MKTNKPTENKNFGAKILTVLRIIFVDNGLLKLAAIACGFMIWLLITFLA